MAYDAQLADRVRRALADRDPVREVRMFGGLALMLDERMVVCVSGSGLLVRVAPERGPELLDRPGASRAVMGKDRPMGDGWITVDGRALTSEEGLRSWLDVALDFYARGPGRASPRSTTSSTATRGGAETRSTGPGAVS